ncbi:hypothetical protein ACSBR2_014905 [Camellia fascicularis]
MVLKRATHLSVEHLQDMKNIFPNLQADVEGLNRNGGISPQAQPPDLQLLFNLEELKLWKLDTFKGICPGALTTSSWVCFPRLRSLEVNTCPEVWRSFLYQHVRNWNKYLILVYESPFMWQTEICLPTFHSSSSLST